MEEENNFSDEQINVNNDSITLIFRDLILLIINNRANNYAKPKINIQ